MVASYAVNIVIFCGGALHFEKVRDADPPSRPGFGI